MSIDKVEVTNSRGDLLILSLSDVSNGYVVEDIGGLGPVKSSIVTSNFATMEGQQRQSSSREARNITIKLGYEPDYSVDQSVRALRSRLYDFFMTTEMVELRFYTTNGVVVKTNGEVETCEPAIFTAEPQMDISILCFDPDFIDPTPVEITNVFSTVDNAPHLVRVHGSAKTGLNEISFTAPKPLSEFTIYHTTPQGALNTMQISAPLQVNDIVRICTIKGKKSITLTRGGNTTSLLWAVSPQSPWVLLERGDNQLYLNASISGPSAPVFVSYNNRYGGI